MEAVYHNPKTIGTTILKFTRNQMKLCNENCRLKYTVICSDKTIDRAEIAQTTAKHCSVKF
jgi:hypothetical protein